MSTQADRRPIEFLKRSLLLDFTEMTLHYLSVPPPIIERFVANKRHWPVGYSDGEFWCRPITKGGFELPEPFRVFRMGGHLDPDWEPEDRSEELEKIEILHLQLGAYDPDLL